MFSLRGLSDVSGKDDCCCIACYLIAVFTDTEVVNRHARYVGNNANNNCISTVAYADEYHIRSRMVRMRRPCISTLAVSIAWLA